MVMRVALELGKFEAEVLALSPDEFGRWVAFFKLRDEESDRQRRAAKTKRRK